MYLCACLSLHGVVDWKDECLTFDPATYSGNGEVVWDQQNVVTLWVFTSQRPE